MSGAGGGMSKAAKKNAKRHAKKQAAAGQPVKAKGAASKPTEPADLLPILKAQLEEAKAAKDIPLAGKLREQIWVLGDLIKGAKTEMPEADLAPIIAKLEALMDSKKDEKSKTSEATTATTAPSADPEKRIKNLQKKLDQIEKLKERQAKGEKLEDGQLEKIKSEDKTLEEIERLEKLIEQ